jgi:hypothetical protein
VMLKFCAATAVTLFYLLISLAPSERISASLFLVTFLAIFLFISSS